MIIHSNVDSISVSSFINGNVISSEVIQNTVYSEELEFTEFEYLLRITQQSAPRSIDDDKLRILQ